MLVRFILGEFVVQISSYTEGLRGSEPTFLRSRRVAELKPS